METVIKFLVYCGSVFIGVIFMVLMFSASAQAKTTDMGVCFLKTDKQTVQSKISEIAHNAQESTVMQQQARFFNDLTSLFVPVDTFNYKLFWVSQPNNEWLTKNCFKFGYITLMDYNRRAITRVYSNPVHIADARKGNRFPANANAIPQADPGAEKTDEAAAAPFDPQAQPAYMAPVPQIHLHNYYTSSNGEKQHPVKQFSEETKKEDNLNVNVNVGDSKKEEIKEIKDNKTQVTRGSVYDLPSYMEKSSYFLELSPLMAYDNVKVMGSGVTNKFSMFGYGTDLKFGYRANQHFNYYLKGRYLALELRSIKSPATAEMTSSSDYSYGLGIEHVASRFLSLAIEYTAFHMQSFEQVGAVTNSESFRENFQTVNLDFKLNFISHDDFRFGLHGNYGIVLADNSDELMYDLRTKLYLLRSFEDDYFGLTLGYEQNRFLYDSGPTSETNRKRFVFGLNFGFDF